MLIINAILYDASFLEDFIVKGFPAFLQNHPLGLASICVWIGFVWICGIKTEYVK